MTQKRKNTRIVFEAKAEIRYADRVVDGEIRNLSMKGMLLVSPEQIEPDTPVSITMYLSGISSNLSLTMNGHVVRADPGGVIALEFDAMDLDTFIHLRSIVTYNEGDEKKIMNEFFDSF